MSFTTLLSIFLVGFFTGYLIHFLLTRRHQKMLRDELQALKKTQEQMQHEYGFLEQAMEGAKAQAEEMQRKLYGTNIMEISEPQDAERILNRQILAKFIYKQMKEATPQSDGHQDDAQPGDAKVIESLDAMDDQVIKILAQAVK